MKNILKLFIFMFLLTINVNLLNASCEEDKVDADNIEFIDLNLLNEEGSSILLRFLNIKSNLYLMVDNDYNNTPVKYILEEGKDYIEFNSLNVNKHINYVVKVYSTDETCGTEALRTIEFTTKKYNSYSSLEVCKGKYDTVPLCDPYNDIEVSSIDNFIKEVNNYKIIEEENTSFIYLLKKYYYFALIPLIVGLIIFTIKVKQVKKVKNNA